MSGKIIRSVEVSGSKRIGVEPKREHQAQTKPKDKPIASPSSQAQDEVVIGASVSNVKETELSAELIGELRLQVQRLETERDELQHKLQIESERLSQQESELEKLKTAAQKEGYEEGKAQGLKSLEIQSSELNKVIQQVNTWMQSSLQGVDTLATDIAFTALCKLVGEGYKSREFVEALVFQVTKHATESQAVQIHLSNRDYELLSQQLPSLKQKIAMEIELVQDSKIPTGGCLVDTGVGMLDGRLETQMNILKDALLNTINQTEGLN